MSTTDFRLINGLSFGVLASTTLYTIKKVAFHQHSVVDMISTTLRDYSWCLLFGFPLGFTVGYHQKPLFPIFLSHLG